MIKRWKKLFFPILLAGCLYSTVCCAVETEKASEGNLTLSFITIGKGDAFLLESPDGEYIMCDTGKKKDWDQIHAVLEQKGVKELKGVFISHGHKDHAGSLKKLMETYPVEAVYLSGKDTVSYRETQVIEKAKEAGVPVTKLMGGEKMFFGDVEFKVWLPEKEDKLNENNNSVVLQVKYKDTSILLTGDMEREEEAQFLAQNIDIHADILKLGHHGERDATSTAFLQRVKPEYGLITGNEAENPESVNPETEAKLAAFNVKAVYSEGDQLAFDFISDGQTIRMKTFGERMG